MIASSILNSITFKNLVGTYPNMWNRLHIDRGQAGKKVIAYNQKFPKDHVVYLQFESDDASAITLKTFYGVTEIATTSAAYASHYGTSDSRYYTNFAITLGSIYYDRPVYFKAIQGSNTLTSEPVFVSDISDEIEKGLIKYVKYTNLDRIESDLDNRFIDWSVVPSTGNYMDFFIEAQDAQPNDKDESEMLEGSQSRSIISATYYSGRLLKTGGVPDYMITKLGVASSVDIFTINDIQYIKSGDLSQSPLGNSTFIQGEIQLSQKYAIGINVDNIGMGEVIITPPIAGSLMYIGSVSSGTPDETAVKLISGIAAVKADQTKSYTITGSRFCFAYPASFGSLASILDSIGDEIISGFDIQTINFTNGSDVVSYKVYTLRFSTTVVSFNVQYKF
jgi:hypothetical protein